MDSTVAPAGVIKRSRQACSGCRKKKIKCSGERPVCMNCRQAQRGCIYEPYSNRNTSTSGSGIDLPAPSALQSAASLQVNAELLQRISTIESMLTRLSGQSVNLSTLSSTSQPRPRADSVSSSETSSRLLGQDFDAFQLRPNDANASEASYGQPLLFDILPPPSVLSSVIDQYFSRVHSQPYAYFHQDTFRQRLQNGGLPKSLQFAVLALAVRFSDHPYYRGKTQEASAEYSKQSWYLVLSDHLMALTSISLPVIQTISILATSDYTAGRVNEGWLKVGLAARLCQAIDLMSEPSAHLPKRDQEERRSTFWSIYILDKLISCARSRPPAISDDDVYVRLAGADAEAEDSELAAASHPTSRPLVNWDTKLPASPQGHTLIVLVTSILGHCTRYAHGRAGVDTVPPWDAKSNFTSTNASLMLLEPYFDVEKTSVADLMQSNINSEGRIPSDAQQQLGHMIFARTLFHLCHCLLNHPFLLRIRLKAFARKVPRSFSLRALQTAEDNARRLTDLLSSAAESGILLESSFYTYCVAVAGAIHSMACHISPQERSLGQYDTQQYYRQSVATIERLTHLWPMATNISARLGTFHELFSSQQGLFEPGLLTSPLEPSFEDLLWSVADYNILAGSLPVSSPFPDHFFNNISAIPSPPLWESPAIESTSASLNLNMAGPEFLQDTGFVFNGAHQPI
ncbi:fungal-specific transcription factor domain-domain-containing protein [Microdochium bolleyi]|uniref:Fungal-specific transcription factor domain-domain-containing protein n=1 Tax=Microdochium bolleyi TaxID=196109 RepID=A0A136IL84_9PEZI|nr:fungal-specific transcription factor domain-domain-containing protein [Microdochium bolleyi]